MKIKIAMRGLSLLICLILFLLSCSKFDWVNPYDPISAKTLFTPSGPGAEMQGNSVKLMWTQRNSKISGFALFRSVEGEPITSLAQVEKTATEYIDATVTAGKRYTYYIVAVAGNNNSDTVKVGITPIFLVSVSTGLVSEITFTSAKVSAEITNAGGGSIISRGICWSTTPGPTISGAGTTAEYIDGTGAFVSNLSSLQPGTIYYARAYSSNSRGVSYGSEVIFSTLGGAKLTTAIVTSISSNGAVSGGDITDDGGTPNTSRGVCWSTSQNPTIANAKTVDSSGTGLFTSNITGLSTSTTYYVRAYATNQYGTTYGQQQTFNSISGPLYTIGSGVTDIDGNTYKTVIIGNQEWMAENLKVTRFSNGDTLINGSNYSNSEWINLNHGSISYYNNLLVNSNTFGSLYTWFAVNDNRNICPEGWHVGTDQEWTELTDFAGGENVAGGKLKETGTLNWTSPNIGATDEFNFSVLPSGFREGSGFYRQGMSGFFWAPNFSTQTIWRREIEYNNTQVLRASSGNGGFSVRCVKNK